MNVPDKLLEICIFFFDDRFVTILKQMAMPAVTPVIAAGIPWQKFAHDRRYPLEPASQKNMGMVGHQSPCIDRRLKPL